MVLKRCGQVAVVLVLLAGQSLAAQSTDPGPDPGEVTLPLQDYLSLVETVERVERERAAQLAGQEAPVAEVVSQRVTARVEGGEAEIVSDFEVLLRGKTMRPVLLPLAGFPEKVEVRDEAGRTGTASVTAVDGGGGVVLAAAQAGKYTVHVTGRAGLGSTSGTGRLALGRVAAPVASTDLDLPADLAWSSPGAVVVEDREQAGRRRVRLATARGADTVLDLRRKVDSAEAEKLLAQSVVLTILQLRPEGLRRHDVVLYEVRRGSLGRFTVELPPGLEVDQAGTDEGTVVPPVVESGRLTVHRQRNLQGVGYLVLTSTPPAQSLAAGVPLVAVTPEAEVRARYLAISSSVAADVAPLPAASWTRVDLSDLPAVLSQALAALDLSAAWRLAGDGAEARLAVAPLPPAPALDATIRLRDTTTLMTVDGTLLFRDRFTIDLRSRSGAALDLVLPAGSTLWSAKVDKQPVRPLERGGTVSVPLGFDGGTAAVVEVVSVLERAIPPGRSHLILDLPQVSVPVLDHRLRLLLPEGMRYRFRRGDLRPAIERATRKQDPWFSLGQKKAATPPAMEPPPPSQAMAVDGVTITAESPLMDERRTDPGASFDFESVEEMYVQEIRGLQQGLVGGVKPLPVTIPESGKLLLLSGVLPPQRIGVELEVKAKR
jgi:hypothetical protein